MTSASEQIYLRWYNWLVWQMWLRDGCPAIVNLA